jgi:hypothetical protein
MIGKIFKKLSKKLSRRQRMALIYFYKTTGWIHKNVTVFFIKLFKKDKEISNINLFEQKFYSQNGEDGIISVIFDKIGTTNKFSVEFGVGNGIECNTTYFTQKYKGNFLLMDYMRDRFPIKKEKVTVENINDLFKKYSVPEVFDLLSIDIDYNDYWIWKAIEGYSPRVVVIEYNSNVPTNESRVVDYDPDHEGVGNNGASLLALMKLGNSKGYTLIGCDNSGTNTFFVRNDLINGNFLVKSIDEVYRPSKHGYKPIDENIMKPV